MNFTLFYYHNLVRGVRKMPGKTFLSTIIVAFIAALLFICILNVTCGKSNSENSGIAIGREVTFSNCSFTK